MFWSQRWTARDTDEVIASAIYGALTGLVIGLYWLVSSLL